MMSTTIAIIGRPNVGKSTLFNRLTGKQLAIVDDTPGVTRDWRKAEGFLFDLSFDVLDTAGLEEEKDDSIRGRMRRQTEQALSHADIYVFMIDGRAGITPLDSHFAGWLRKQKKPVILCINKAETMQAVQSAVAESYSLGFGEPAVISSAHGEGLETLYDLLKGEMEKAAPPKEDDEEDDISGEEDAGFLGDLDAIEGDEEFVFEQEEDTPEKPIKMAIVGRPNVGKSTLLNAIVDDHRVMTGPEAGITRDAVTVEWIYKERPFKLVDTAGIRRKSKLQDGIEKMSVEDSFRAIRLSQIVILVLDSLSALEKQDLQLAEHILEEGRAMVIALNKWDTAGDYEGGHKELVADLQWKMQHALSQARDLRYVRISALNGKNIDKLLDEALNTYAIWNKRVPTGPLNRWLRKMESHNPAPLVDGRPNRLKYIAQIKTRPPTFALWVSHPKKLTKSYRRYITNGLRNDFDIPSVPVRLLVRSSKNPYG